ncbi:MAG: SPOR domain-containing protein [Woeseiaceae bacterium]|nr:SPOR domain-containing protein [Woeseiaceae bacterium]
MARRKSKKDSGRSSVLSMLFGLAVGLSVAVAVYMKDRRPAPEVVEPEPASLQDALDNNGESAAADPPPAESKEEKRFTFYDILPNVEVVTPDKTETRESSAPPQAVVEPGTYVLQAGSFSTHQDADRRRAELGMHGIESHIQRVKVNDRNYHRVYIGPTDDLDELNMLRSRLRAAQIDVLRIRLSD